MTATVPYASIALMAVSACLMLFFPIGLYISRRKRMGFRFFPLVLGSAVFILFAAVIEQLTIRSLFSIAAVQGFLTSRAWIYALFGGLMAGLFEESGRLCAFFFILNRRHDNLGSAISYGIGHGGIETVLVAFLPMVGNLISSVMVNTVGAESLLALAPGQEAAVTQSLQLLAGSPPVTFLAGGIERVVAVCFQIAASVLVWMAATVRGPWGLYFLAILLHTAVNLPAGLYQYGALTNIWMVEGMTAVAVLIVCVITYGIYDRCSRNYTSLLHYNPTDFGI